MRIGGKASISCAVMPTVFKDNLWRKLIADIIQTLVLNKLLIKMQYPNFWLPSPPQIENKHWLQTVACRRKSMLTLADNLHLAKQPENY